MTNNRFSTSLLFAGILILSGCGSDDIVNSSANTSTPTTSTPASTTAAPTVASTAITTTSGKTIQVNRTQNGLVFGGQEGKIVVLEIYGHTCPFCINAIPIFNNIRAKYPNDVYVIAMESYGQLDNAGLQQYVASNGIQYDTVATSNAGSMFAFMNELTGYTTNQGVPAYLILGRDGALVEYAPPHAPNQSVIEGYIQGLL